MRRDQASKIIEEKLLQIGDKYDDEYGIVRHYVTADLKKQTLSIIFMDDQEPTFTVPYDEV